MLPLQPSGKPPSSWGHPSLSQPDRGASFALPFACPPRPPRPPHPPRPTPSSSRPAPPAHCGCCAPSLLPPRPFREAVFHTRATDHASKIHSTPGLPLLRTPGGGVRELGANLRPPPRAPGLTLCGLSLFLAPLPNSPLCLRAFARASPSAFHVLLSALHRADGSSLIQASARRPGSPLE